MSILTSPLTPLFERGRKRRLSQKGDEKEKKAILLSGGVDSAVAALLMKERGFDVEGFCMVTDYFSPDVADRAKKAADHLGIKLNIIDVSEEFKKRVMEYFENEYQNLRTPNPCVMCNKRIKFGVLYDKIRELGFETICTGHYIKKVQSSKFKVQRNIKDQISNIKDNNELQVISYKLQAARDQKKDQSYFLYNLTQEHLKHLEFPLGDLTKDEVWEIARKNNLPIPEGESQDICFLPARHTAGAVGGRGDHNDYLRKYLKLAKGPIIDKSGKILGEHFGLPLYTIGQRRWIKIGGTGPYYVLRTDLKSNTLFVTDRFDDPDLYSDEFEVENVNWIDKSSKFKVQSSNQLKVKIRYLHSSVIIKFIKEIKDGRFLIGLKEKQRAITPGQSAVFYGENGELLGGGIIL